MGEEVLNPYRVQRTWDKAKSGFSSIEGQEETYGRNLLYIEQQVFTMARKDPALADEDVALAFAVCGLNVLAFFEGGGKPRLTGFSPVVEELARNCLGTFHPDYNPDIDPLVETVWRTHEDVEFHFRTYGSVLRRLSDSVRFWTRRGGRKGYLTYVATFLKESGLVPRGDKIHCAVVSLSAAGPRS